MAKSRIIGIDFGTNYSSVGVCRPNGTIEILANEDGQKRTPSVVAFTETECLLGERAEKQRESNPSNTIFNMKRLIGRRFDDTKIQHDLMYLPFEVDSKFDKIRINATYRNQGRHFAAEEICSMILEKLKEMAEEFLGKTVEKAVITVPVSFSYSQREAIRSSAKIAGLKIVKMLNESTAAALSYGFEKNFDTERNVLVFNLGGGNLDVSLLKIRGLSIEVKAVAGKTHFGGEDFDNETVDYLANEIQHKFRKDIRNYPDAFLRLRDRAKEAKHELSTKSETTIEIESLFGGIDFKTELNRKKFEDLNSDLFPEILEPVKKVLKDARIDKGLIDDVVLTGGSTRIPKIRQILETYFVHLHELTIQSEESIVFGTTLQALLLSAAISSKVISLQDVIPLPLTLKALSGKITRIFPRNTKTPCENTVIFPKYTDKEETVRVRLIQGDEICPNYNNYFGFLLVCGIGSGPPENHEIRVTFRFNTNGILDISAEDEATELLQLKVKIENDENRLSKTEIKRMIAETRQYKNVNEAEEERIKTRNLLEHYIFRLQLALSDYEDRLTEKDKERFRKHLDEYSAWFKENPFALKEKFQSMLDDVDNTYDTMMSKIKNSFHQKSYMDTDGDWLMR